jgi:phosphoribosyl-dephospho-CoA transferase
MDPVMIDGAPAPTHDLLRLRDPSAVRSNAPLPPWAEESLRRTPWVVVRRGYIENGAMPIGVRGTMRSQRFAGWLAVADVVERRSPEDLRHDFANCPRRTATTPALVALTRVAPILTRRGYRWGPGGSIAFELATGSATASASSDLDLILRQARRLEPNDARTLHDALVEAAAPVRVDAILETPRGGVSLAELAAAPTHVLVRTAEGPILAADPWATATDAWTERGS